MEQCSRTAWRRAAFSGGPLEPDHPGSKVRTLRTARSRHLAIPEDGRLASVWELPKVADERAEFVRKPEAGLHTMLPGSRDVSFVS